MRITHNPFLGTKTEMGFPVNSELPVLCSLLRFEETESILSPTLCNLFGLHFDHHFSLIHFTTPIWSHSDSKKYNAQWLRRYFISPPWLRLTFQDLCGNTSTGRQSKEEEKPTILYGTSHVLYTVLGTWQRRETLWFTSTSMPGKGKRAEGQEPSFPMCLLTPGAAA